VRGEIVEAAFRAIDRLGPDLSVREIAEEAGTAKPKIYRHFNDKSDLFQAIGARLRDMLWTAIFPSVDFATNSAREVIRRSVEEYVNLVDQHPNVLRFFIQGRFPEQSEATVRTLNEGREITLAMAEMFNNELREMELDRAAIELAAFAAFGSAASATDWWLGPTPDSPRRMPREQFVAHLTTIMMGVINGTAEVLGIQYDPDLPLHNAVPRKPAAS
jgi:AcrR family transcriptional regulator